MYKYKSSVAKVSEGPEEPLVSRSLDFWNNGFLLKMSGILLDDLVITHLVSSVKESGLNFMRARLFCFFFRSPCTHSQLKWMKLRIVVGKTSEDTSLYSTVLKKKQRVDVRFSSLMISHTYLRCFLQVHRFSV